MPNEIKVGPSLITINQGNMFMVTFDNGEINSDSELGFFAQDTRFVSRYQIRIEGIPWSLATSSAVSYYGARYYLVSPQVETTLGTIRARELALTMKELSETVCTRTSTLQIILIAKFRSSLN